MTSKPVTIGIAGGSGSGKSLLTNEIRGRLGPCNAVIIQHDCYYKDRSEIAFSERESINYDCPDALGNELLVEHVQELIAGRSVRVPEYDFSTHCRKPSCTEIQPGRVILIEGILIFTIEKLRPLMDIKIFVDADDDIRLRRRLNRDIQGRGRDIQSIMEQYFKTTKPMHERYVLPSRRYADIIVTDAANSRAIDMIVSSVRNEESKNC